MHLISDYLFEEKILFFSIVNLIFIGIIDATKQFIITAPCECVGLHSNMTVNKLTCNACLYSLYL